ncbi:MAG: baseplate J/gp47 family protein [Desulforudis sp.]|nr:MAG: baseplate J/gp47 family protein [Desulforudis sp.]
MAFERPTLQEIVDRIAADFQARIDGAESLLRRAVLKVMARVYGGAVHLLYGFLDFMADQLFASSAEVDYLETIGGEYGLARTAATKASGTGTATGTAGLVIPADSELESVAGVRYATDQDNTLGGGGSVTVSFTAVDAGAAGNDDPGISLTFISPIAGVDTTVTVGADGITGGADEEDDDSYRERVLFRKRQPPHGGCEYDYEAWALEVGGVTRVWTFPEYMGVGTIGVAFMRDNDLDPFPNAAQREIVRAYLVSHTDQETGETVGIPVTAEPGLFMIALTPLAVNFSINIAPNTAAVRAAVEQQLADLIATEGGPGQTLYLSRISEAVSQAGGEEHHTLVGPAANVTAAVDEIHVLGANTFGDD